MATSTTTTTYTFDQEVPCAGRSRTKCCRRNVLLVITAPPGANARSRYTCSLSTPAVDDGDHYNYYNLTCHCKLLQRSLLQTNKGIARLDTDVGWTWIITWKICICVGLAKLWKQRYSMARSCWTLVTTYGPKLYTCNLSHLVNVPVHHRKVISWMKAFIKPSKIQESDWWDASERCNLAQLYERHVHTNQGFLLSYVHALAGLYHGL